QRGPYVLEFVPRDQSGFLSGYARLLVPAEQITPGQPVELRVAHIAGAAFAFFQIKGRDDTVQVEHVGLEGLVPAAEAAAGQGAEGGGGGGAAAGWGAGRETTSPPPAPGAPPA